MSRKLKILHIVAVASIALYYAVAFWMCGMSFDESNCTDLGIVIAPLLIPSLILVPVLIITDLTILVRRFAPHNLKRFVSWLIPSAIVAAIIIVLAILTITSYRKDHYSVDKTVAVIQNCQTTDIGYNGTDIFLSTIPSAGDAFDVKVPGSGHERVLQALKDSAARCHYDIKYNGDLFYLGF